MKKKLFIAVLIFALLACAVWAEGTAVFVDLGFSPDGKIYMFGQYGVQPGTLLPWAEIYAVNVVDNVFVPGGKLSYIHDCPVTAGQDGSGALYRLLASSGDLARSCKVSFLLQGQPLYVAMENGIKAPGGETIEFRNFEKGDAYRAALVATQDADGSSFYLKLDRSGANGSRSYIVGNPKLKRPGVVSYRIRRVVCAPRDGSVVFIIEMKKHAADGGTDLRYMVETIRP